MKIFFPLEVFYPSQAGGPANSIYWLTKNLSEHGIESIIVSTDKGLKNSVAVNQWATTEFGTTIYVKTRKYNFPFRHTLVALLNFRKGDIVHVSSIFFPTAFVVSFASRICKKKIVLSPRGELDTKALTHARYKKIPILWLTKKIVGTYPTFHSTCAEETEYIKEAFGRDADVFEMPNYIELPEQSERTPSNYVLFIGRLHPKKAIDNLIRAVSMSNEFMESDFVLKIAGKGKPEFEAKLKNLVSGLNLDKKIEFVGQIEGAGKQKLFADAHFTILPSHTENFGNVVLESLAQSTPVAASKGTPWKVLEDEQIGFWTDNSPGGLAKTLTKIIRMDQESYTGFRKRSRNFVKREFDIKSNIQKWVHVYKELL